LTSWKQPQLTRPDFRSDFSTAKSPVFVAVQMRRLQKAQMPGIDRAMPTDVAGHGC
jgi:hypothetical protein